MNFNELSFAEQRKFFNSIDWVLSDCDGVIWRGTTRPGCGDVINKFNEMGKKVVLVSNNSYHSWENYEENIKATGIVNVTEDDVIFPAKSIVQYLQSINFKKKLYVSCSPPMLKAFDEAGFEYDTGENLDAAHVYQQTHLDPDVGAVIFDSNPYRNYMTTAKGIQYLLKRPDILYIVGATDMWSPFSRDVTVVGPGHYQKLMSDATNRRPLVLGKPGNELGKFLIKKYNITDPRRVLFMGDSIEQDTAFAQNQGFRDLLVLTGVTDKKTAETGIKVDGIAIDKEDEKDKVKPEFYLESLTDLLPVLNKIQQENDNSNI